MNGKQQWRGPLFIAAIVIFIAISYWPTVLYLVTANGAIGHVAFVLCIFLALIWSLRFRLAELRIRPSLIGLFGLIGVGCIWVAGELVFIRVLTELAVLSMVSMTVWATLGRQWLFVLIFPLCFLLFAVPIGGPLVPLLVEWTATVAVSSLQATGVPVYRDGSYLLIPTGSWAIADTCSGIAFFNLCLMIGSLYAWLMYRSPFRRLVFLAGAVTIGVVGNWVRVYLTILISHLSDNRLLRDGHETEGWFLFAIMLLAYGWLGLRLQEGEQSKSSPFLEKKVSTGVELGMVGGRRFKWTVLMLVSTALTLCIWPLLASKIANAPQKGSFGIAKIEASGGWIEVDGSRFAWTPILQNPTKTYIQTFEKDGRRVGVFIGLFQNQTWDSKLVTSVNRLADSDDRNWTLIERGTANSELSGKPVVVESGIVRGRGTRILAWRWYWIDGTATASNLKAKGKQLLAILRGTNEKEAWVAIYTEANLTSDGAATTLDKFMREMGGPLERAIGTAH